MLENNLNITGSVLNWLKSYLTEHQHCVSIDNKLSNYKPLVYGVPQGSVLGPKIFSMYMLPLYKTLREIDVDFHCYADDTQFYLKTNSETLNETKTQIIHVLKTVNIWLNKHFLKMNPSKTEIIILGGTDEIQLKFCEIELKSKEIVRNLGIILDNKL